MAVNEQGGDGSEVAVVSSRHCDNGESDISQEGRGPKTISHLKEKARPVEHSV